MSNKFDYILSPDGELYHWEKKDHKYISREKKNGKWTYEYPSENKGGRNASREYLAETSYNSESGTPSVRTGSGQPSDANKNVRSTKPTFSGKKDGPKPTAYSNTVAQSVDKGRKWVDGIFSKTDYPSSKRNQKNYAGKSLDKREPPPKSERDFENFRRRHSADTVWEITTYGNKGTSSSIFGNGRKT